jgi:hypothetical protein
MLNAINETATPSFQHFAKRHNLKWLANQAWNLKTIPTYKGFIANLVHLAIHHGHARDLTLGAFQRFNLGGNVSDLDLLA